MTDLTIHEFQPDPLSDSMALEAMNREASIQNARANLAEARLLEVLIRIEGAIRTRIAEHPETKYEDYTAGLHDGLGYVSHEADQLRS